MPGYTRNHSDTIVSYPDDGVIGDYLGRDDQSEQKRQAYSSDHWTQWGTP